MNTGTDSSSALRSSPDWLPKLARSQGLLIDALEANRAGRYTDAQVQLLERRGRSVLKRGATPALGALGISSIGFLSTLGVASRSRDSGVVTGPGPEFLFTAPLVSLILMVVGCFVLRPAWRSWQNLRADLRQNRISFVEGQVTLKGPALVDYISSKRPENLAMQERYAYMVNGVIFRVDPKAYSAFPGSWADSRFRVYYVPSCNWIVNMEPISRMFPPTQ